MYVQYIRRHNVCTYVRMYNTPEYVRTYVYTYNKQGYEKHTYYRLRQVLETQVIGTPENSLLPLMIAYIHNVRILFQI